MGFSLKHDHDTNGFSRNYEKGLLANTFLSVNHFNAAFLFFHLLFSQRIRRLAEWCEKNDVPSVIIDPITKLRKNIAAYRVAYDHPKAHRTSNMVDRLMQRMDRHLYSTQYFHGSMDLAQLSIRGWTLINNFAPYNPRTVKAVVPCFMFTVMFHVVLP